MDRQIVNAVTGDRIVFANSPMMGDGDELIFRCTLPPLAIGAPLHVHDAMTESFEVVSGALEIDLGDGRSRRLRPGERLEIVPGTPHGFRNPLRRETVFVTTAGPGIALERFLRSLYALANSGHTKANGAPRNPLAMAAMLARMDMALVGIPLALQTLAVAVLARFATVCGIDRKLTALVATGGTGER